MLSITKVNNSIKVEGLDNKQFPDNGTLMIPLNSVILTLDESNIATFRSAANNDVLFSGVITDIQISGTPMTKQTITTAFTNVANSSGGGGGTVDAYTKAETDALLATKANESELSDYATVESLAAVATSGDYDDLSNKPTIPVVPTDVSAFNNDAGYITQEEVIINEAFPNGWHTTGTMADLIADINADTDAVAGKVYMDTVSFSDLPANMQQAELKAEIISQLGNSKVIVFTVTSSEVSPYHWEYTSAYGQTNSWREWVTPAAMQSALSVKANSADLATVATSGDYTDLSNTPNLATVATTGDYDDLTNKPTIPAEQVQSDWDEADTTSKAYIQNKPTIPTVPTNVSAFTNDAGYTTNTGTITGITMNGTSKGTSGVVDLGTVITEHQSLEGYVQSTDLATVATTGDYADLTNKPVIPAAQVQSDWNEADNTSKAYIQNKPSLATVATTGDYDDLSNKPTIPTVPTNVSAFTNDAGYVQSTDLATVATTGDYNDLSNKPTIPAAQVQSDWTEADSSSKAYIQNKPNLATVATSGNYSDLNGTPSLATVATTGDYDDLTNKPTIPTVPTNVSAFTNDAGYTTNTGTITGITMNGASKGTSGVVDLGTVVTDKSDKQDTLVSGTNIKTINNESLLGSGNITISGGSSYTAGDNIDITNDVISVDIDDEKKVIASSLVELHNDKADKQQLNNYQLKGDYATRTEVTEGLSLKANVTALSDYRTEVEAINVEKVNAAALNDLDARVSTLEQGGGGGGITGITMNGSAVTVTSGVANLGAVVTDKSDKQDIIDSSHKLSADLVDDTNTTNKFVTASDKTTWGAKQDALVSGTNIKTINNESILGSGNITIQGGDGISGITMNGSPVTVTSGVADLGTVITEHQSLANYYTKTEIDAMIGQINTLLAAI